MYKHILVPVAPDHIDESASALGVAERLRVGNGRISVLTVLEELPSYVGTYFPKEQMQKSIAEFADALGSKVFSCNIDTYVLSGHPTNTVLDWAKKSKVDCIVVSSHRPGLSAYLLGSTAARVVRHAECSVVVLR